MGSGRPREPNDPSVMSSVELALSAMPRPGPAGRAWHWRYELALVAGPVLAAIAVFATLGLAWLIALATTALVVVTVAVTWPRTRRRLIARAWCVITPHRVRTGCAHAWVQTRDGRLPVVLYTTPAEFGERVLLWCRAGITAGDLRAARDILRTACWASDVRVIVNDRRSHIVVLEVIRRLPAERPVPRAPEWPYLADRAEADGSDSEEPALSGSGNLSPFG